MLAVAPLAATASASASATTTAAGSWPAGGVREAAWHWRAQLQSVPRRAPSAHLCVGMMRAVSAWHVCFGVP